MLSNYCYNTSKCSRYTHLDFYSDKCEVIATAGFKGFLSRHQCSSNIYGSLEVLPFSVSAAHCRVYVHRFALFLPSFQSLRGVFQVCEGQIRSDAVPDSVAHNAFIAVVQQLFTAETGSRPKYMMIYNLLAFGKNIKLPFFY